MRRIVTTFTNSDDDESDGVPFILGPQRMPADESRAIIACILEADRHQKFGDPLMTPICFDLDDELDLLPKGLSVVSLSVAAGLAVRALQRVAMSGTAVLAPAILLSTQ
jgi:hypothetical protein